MLETVEKRLEKSKPCCRHGNKAQTEKALLDRIRALCKQNQLERLFLKKMTRSFNGGFQLITANPCFCNDENSAAGNKYVDLVKEW
jgi:predicted secreted protein